MWCRYPTGTNSIGRQPPDAAPGDPSAKRKTAMPKFFSRRLCILLAISPAALPLLVALGGETKDAAKTQYFRGQVQPLKDVLKKSGVALDADAAGHWFALVADDGKVYPLIKDNGSRMFFKDAKLLNRPMRLTGRLLGDSHLLQVVNVHSELKGKLHDVYYWCEICAIKRFQAGICDCCGDKLEFRETPIK